MLLLCHNVACRGVSVHTVRPAEYDLSLHTCSYSVTRAVHKDQQYDNTTTTQRCSVGAVSYMYTHPHTK